MFNWIKKLFRKKEAEVPASSPLEKNEVILGLERKIGEFQLDLNERDKTINQLKQDLKKEQQKKKQDVSEIVEDKIERLISEVATPVSQLITQAHLIEKENKTVQVKDVLCVARSFIRALETNGLKFEGSVGENVIFNPNLHEALSGSDSFSDNQQVKIRFVGIKYEGKIVRKARTQPIGD